MPWFDLLNSAMGNQNPYDEARAYQAAQTAANNAALGLGPGPQGQGAPPPADSAKGPTPITAPGQDPSQPQATATPKDLGSIMLDLQQYNQRDQMFNRGMGGIFSGFSQPRDREMVARMFDVNEPDPTKLGETLMNLNAQQQGQNRADVIGRMVNDPQQGPLIAQKMNMDWGLLKAGIATDPGMIGKIAQVLGTPTEGQRNLGAAQAAIAAEVKAAHPDWTPAQVQAEVNRRAPPEMLLSGVAGGDLEQQQYFQEVAGQRARGEPVTPYAEWKVAHQAQAIESATHTKDVVENRDAAVLDYPHIDQTLSRSEAAVDKLLGDLDHTVKAINTPDVFKSGLFAANAPGFMTASKETKDQAGVLSQLMAELQGSALRDVRNVRNVREFNVLGDALTAALKPGNSPDAVRQALQDLKTKFAQTRAIARDQAGMSVQEAPKESGPPLSDDDLIKKYSR